MILPLFYLANTIEVRTKIHKSSDKFNGRELGYRSRESNTGARGASSKPNDNRFKENAYLTHN